LVPTKNDLLRVLAYGSDPYYAAIRAHPAYQAELERTRENYKGRSWIESPFKWPKFTDDEFEQKRVEYQARYGTKIAIPAFEDIVHWKLPTKISTEEMAAHRFSKKRKLPSPLNPEQLLMLTARKYRFLKALASPTPKWMQNFAAIQNSLDDAEDALVTTAVLGRWAAKLSPRLLGRAVPYLGWVLLGSDIINLTNLFTWMRFAGNPTSCKNNDLANKNPFHHKAALARAKKLTRKWTTVGEMLEILQTTDQVFGVGLSLGGIVGAASDTIATAQLSEEYRIKGIAAPFRKPSPAFLGSAVELVRQLIRPFKQPTPFEQKQMRSLRGSMILSTFKDDVPRDFHTRAYIAANTAVQSLTPWWSTQDPIETFRILPSIKIPAPPVDNDVTIDILEDNRIDPDEPQKWPHLGVAEATAEEILYSYAPLIKDSLQTYSLRYQRDYEGMIGAWSAVDFMDAQLTLLDDGGQVRIGRTACANVAQQMMESVHLIPPDTPAETIAAFADWVGRYERQTGESPKLSEFSAFGRSIGIQWMHSFPRIAFERVSELFPGWQAIQDQVGRLFVPD
jgi:hypothetical protein